MIGHILVLGGLGGLVYFNEIALSIRTLTLGTIGIFFYSILAASIFWSVRQLADIKKLTKKQNQAIWLSSMLLFLALLNLSMDDLMVWLWVVLIFCYGTFGFGSLRRWWLRWQKLDVLKFWQTGVSFLGEVLLLGTLLILVTFATQMLDKIFF